MLVPVALGLLAINGIAVGLWLGPLVARYRDVGQIVNSLCVSSSSSHPVFWVTTDVSNAQLGCPAGWNPLAYFLEFFRGPLLGEWPTTAVVVGTLVVTVLNGLIALVHFSHTRDRLAYWL